MNAVRHIGLRNNILIILIVLLTIAMVLIDFVVIVSVHRLLIRQEIKDAFGVIARLEKQHRTIRNGLSVDAYFKARFQEIFWFNKASCIMICDENACDVSAYEGKDAALESLRTLVHRARRTGQKTHQYYGALWRVFSDQSPELHIAAPLKENGDAVAGVGVVLKLHWVYEVMKQLQRITLIYIFINIVVFSIVGSLLLVKITVNPINRLLKRAEDYHEDEHRFLIYEQQNEFNQLSQALNRMLQRISSDKVKLQHTVNSLEKANRDLTKAQEEVIRAEKLASVGRLSSGIAHEIGNPISIVLGYLELLQRSDLSWAERDEFISRSQKEINRVNAIIQQLLNFSRPSDGALRKISVHELIEDVGKVLKDHPLLSHVEFKIDLKSEKDVVTADPDKLRQVFLNLIMNASDAISAQNGIEKGKIRISSETAQNDAAAGMLKIQFIDNGEGIPGELLDNIFDPFFTTKAPGKGTGLGLSVSYMIIDAIGGKITAESERGKGAAITLLLPLVQEVSA